MLMVTVVPVRITKTDLTVKDARDIASLQCSKALAVVKDAIEAIAKQDRRVLKASVSHMSGRRSRLLTCLWVKPLEIGSDDSRGSADDKKYIATFMKEVLAKKLPMKTKGMKWRVHKPLKMVLPGNVERTKNNPADSVVSFLG